MVILTAVISTPFLAKPMSQNADLLITNAQILTMDRARPRATTLAIRHNRLVYVGNAEDSTGWWARRTIDAQGCTVLPGLIDSHFHLEGGSLHLADLQVEGVTHLAALGRKVQEYAAANPQKPYILGFQLPYLTPPPTRHDLDRWVGDRPLLIFAYDMHTAWANTLALEKGGVLRGRAVGSASEIVMAEDGTATGELRENEAMDPVYYSFVPEPTEAGRLDLLRLGLRDAAAVGLTSVHNMDGDILQISRYATLYNLDQLSLRLYVPYSVTPKTNEDDLIEAVAMRDNYHSDMVRSGAVKFFMDGVIESYTGLLLEEYADRPGCLGEALYSEEHFTRMATEADRLGLQIFVHVIGDGAVRRALAGFAAAQAINGKRDSRHRLEHIELISPLDVHSLAELGILASMQPLHAPPCADGLDVWPTRIGSQRWRHSFAWQTLRQAGTHLAFGSDWPVVSQNPFLGMHLALNRQPWQPGDPDQRQTLMDTIAAYTRDAAYAEFQEHQKGQLRPGYLADCVLLDRDLLATPHEEIATIKPVLTICDGRVVFEA
jgi:predicted amidohydrolase YtcJ